MGDVLFLSRVTPYPPDQGDRIRTWHVLKHLAARARVHVGAFADDPAEMRQGEMLRSMCGDVFLQPIPKHARLTRGLRALRAGEALSVGLYYDPAMVAWVRETFRRRAISSIYVFSSQMARYAAAHLGGRRSVIDFVDVDSDRWSRDAAQAGGWRSLVYGREAKLMRGVEKLAARHYNHSIFASETEAAQFRRIAGSYGHAVEVIGNGVDFDYFAPAGGFQPERFPATPTLVFTGTMDDRANIDAVTWFVERVWPMVRAGSPTAEFRIVGADPVADVRKLDGKEGIVVTGRVPDIRPYIAGADIVVAPMRMVRGVHNKVLEAMAMGKPVVASTGAAKGIEARGGTDLIAVDRPSDMASAILRLAGDPGLAAAIGAAGRTQIVQRYAWDKRLAPLDARLGLALQSGVAA